MATPEQLDAINDQALRWLARREYGRHELQRRLRGKGYDDDAIEHILEQLQRNGLQSDQRYTESYIRSRSGRGFGPLRIRAELGERGISSDLITTMLDPNAPEWQRQACNALGKRFADAPTDLRQRAQRERFLRYRGFDHGQIAQAMAEYA